MALSHYQSTAVDDQGNVLSSATITVWREGSGALAALKTDRSGVTGKSNPFTITSGAGGQFDFYVVGGAYKIEVVSGSLTRTLRYVALGTAAEVDLVYASLNTVVGYESFYSNTTGDNNTTLGYRALYYNTTGNYNTASGYQTLYSNTTGSYNTASGINALYSNTTGVNNTASGMNVLYANTTGSYNTASGANTLRNNVSGDNNTASGVNALYSNTTGTYNAASGVNALYTNTTGVYNTASGANALRLNTTGNYNVASGANALRENTTGNYNTASGANALYFNTTGVYNTASGSKALYNTTTGSGNIGIGFLNSAGTYSPVFDPTTESNRLVMGHTAVTNAYVQVAWTVVSDARDKTDIRPVDIGLEFVKQLRPKSFKFRANRDSEETHGRRRYGFLAQDVLEMEGRDPIIVDDEDPDRLKYNGESLVPVLVRAIQELSEQVEDMRK